MNRPSTYPTIHWLCLVFLFWGGGQVLHASAFPTVSISTTSVSCPGGSDASAQATLSGTNPSSNYTYLWSNGASTPSVFGLTAGVYSVTVTETLTGYQFFDIAIVDEPDPIVLDVAITDLPCFNQNQGAIDLTVGGGTPPFSYSWTNASGQQISNSQDLTNLSQGIYEISVSDSRGCSKSRSVFVDAPASALDHNVSSTDVSCFLGMDGELNVVAFGGTPPYTYDWNNGFATSPSLSGLSAGIYNLLITDANGCLSSSSNLLSQPVALQPSFTATPVNCFGGNDGAIDLSIFGGSPPYSYVWTNSVLTLGGSQDLIGIPAEVYAVSITDAKGCTENLSIPITSPDEILLQTSLTQVACAGQATGSIDLSVSGGVPPYQYIWTRSSGAQVDTTQDLTNLRADTYNLSLTDANGCSQTLSLDITEPLSPISIGVDKTDVLCFGQNTGGIDLRVGGGTPPYQYNWSNGAISQDLNQLVAGNYSILVSDAEGCTESLSISIEQPSAPLQITTQVRAASCFGFDDGAIDLSVSGGSSPYTYAWSNSRFNLSFASQDLQEVQAESYALLLTDDNGCTLRDTIRVDQPEEIEGEFSLYHVDCFGEASGAVDVDLRGGVLPYSFEWSNGTFQEDLEEVEAGAYRLEVRDAQGCLFSREFRLEQPLAPLSVQAQISDVSCPGGGDGSIIYEANGGTAPYTYTWSNNSTEENQFELSAGTYEILLTDALGCQRRDSFAVAQPDFFNIGADIDPVGCAGESSGGISLDIQGGTSPFTYLWRNSKSVLFAKDNDLIDVPADTYTVSITDTLGCKGEASFVLPEPDSLEILIIEKDVSCFGANDGSVELQLSGGVLPYSFLWSNQSSGSSITNLSPGFYEVLVSDANGCNVPLGFDIDEPQPLRMQTAIKAASCIDRPDGEVEVFASGGKKGYRFFANDEEFGNPIAGLLGGEYRIRLEDQTGCRVDTFIELPFLNRPCLDIPNAFTPNGDGQNDVWRIKDLAIYPNPQIIIFNQWGMIVFESKDSRFEWDGLFGGNPLPAQTYYYVIRPNPDRAEISGDITIVR